MASATGEGRTGRTVYVGGLDPKVTEELLAAAFIPFGQLAEVQIPKEWKESGHRGFGFVTYAEAEDAVEAVDNMDGSELLGRVLMVNAARPPKRKLGAKEAVWTKDEWLKAHSERISENNNESDSLTPLPLKPDE
eukprot:511185_1